MRRTALKITASTTMAAAIDRTIAMTSRANVTQNPGRASARRVAALGDG